MATLCEAFPEEFVDGVGAPRVDADLVEHAPGGVTNVILGDAPRGCLSFSALCPLALFSTNPRTSGNAPYFQVHTSSTADAALTLAAASSTSSEQQPLHSLASCSSFTISSSLEHLEHTSVSVKPRSLHPTLLAPSEVVARSRVSARALTNARHILPPKDARRT
eukprot:CAMPEP_0180145904 /NCGR_PEP_ID=MMETSP0986-20121125/18056_1 /TAXON_ID=697907 /ORGANISM="non described non described, Strain CCMP2293" /LENGTH=163 /DNA_ID=CAMNT_0022090587 /DNA_START=389 /DNA_END=877 /DNA_ORIENTATION=-